ncbi:MAG: hypothetical protein ACM3X7_10895 [Solirubrobacterales bacterium]
MNSVTVKCVKFGDSSTIKIDNHQLIIDCGSDSRGNNMTSSEFAYSAIANDLYNDNQTDLLITHFHKDHFNGILNIPELQRKLTNVYLPYSIIQGENIYAGAISKLLVLASPHSWGFRLSSNIINLFLKLECVVLNPTNIKFVRAGDTISIANKTIRVLWPDCTFDIAGLKTVESNVKYISTDTKEVIETQTQISEDFAPTLGTMFERLKNEYDELINDIRSQGYDSGEIESSQWILNSELEKYLGELHSLKNKDGNNNYDNSKLQNAYTNSRKANQHLWSFISNNELLTMKIKNFSRNQYHSLINTMNALSIVCDLEEQFVYLGDVPGDVIGHINSSFRAYYQVVKLQHHGTKDYYTNLTPKGAHYIVSNGGYSRRKVGKQFITSLDNGLIFCTNAHEAANEYCSYYADLGRCKETCVKLSGKKVIQFK